MGEKLSYPALGVFLSAMLAPMTADAQARGAPAPSKPRPSTCCTTSDLFLCRDFQICHPFPSRAQSSKRSERLQDRAVLAFGPKLLPMKALTYSPWTAVAAAQSSPVTAAAASVTKTAVTTRAGHIRDNEAEPDFPIISQGSAVWEPSPDGGSIKILVTIEQDALQLELAFRSARAQPLTIELSGSAGQGLTLSEMPRARRAGSVEGEPLLGRIAPGAGGGSRVELSTDPIDLTNNKRRLLANPWLDFRLSDRSGKTSVIAIEKGKAVTDMLSQLLNGTN